MRHDEMVEKRMKAHFEERLKSLPTEGGTRIISPFYDADGDPIQLMIIHDESGYVLNDMEQIAGLLFSLNQDEEGSAGFNLLKRLCKAYEITIDYNQGLLIAYAASDNLTWRLWDFVKLLVSMHTVLPHLKEKERKKRESLGPRLSSRFKKEFSRLQILNLMQQSYAVVGSSGKPWAIDYKYIHRVGGQDIFLVTIDLGMKEPLRKSEHALALALDVLATDGAKQLRFVYDTYGKNSEVEKAVDLINEHRRRVGYEVYNYSDAKRREMLKQTIWQELAPESTAWQRWL